MASPEFRGKLKNGDLSYRLRVANGRLKNGKTKYSIKTITVSKDLTDAKRNKLLLEETVKFEEEIKRGKHTNGIVFFREYAKDWLYTKKRLAPSTYRDYQGTVKKLVDEFGQYKLNEITSIMIIKFYEKLRETGNNKNDITKGLSEKTIKNIHDVLNNIFECAVEDDLIYKNPLRGKNFPAPKPIKKDIKFLDEEDIVKFAMLLKNEKLIYQCITRMCLDNGARIGEIQALEWKDINFKTGDVSITKTLQKVSGIDGLIEKPPKTKNSIRVVRIGEDTLNLLLQLKKEQEEKKNKLGDLWQSKIELKDANKKTFIKDNDKIFTQWNGLPIYPTTYRDWLSKFCKRNNLKQISPHSLRHTFATLSVEENQPINAISKILGHSNITTTSNIYIKATDKSKEILSNVMTNKMSSFFEIKK